VSATQDLLFNYQHVIESFELITGNKGAFELVVDGETLYSKNRTGRHANDGELLQLFAELVGPEVPTYGT